MNKKIFFVLILIIISLVSVPLFADISIDIGISALGSAVQPSTRPLGAIAGIGFTLFENKAIVQVLGGFFSPPLGDVPEYQDPAGILSAGVLFSPMEYLYLGFRTGMITPVDSWESVANYGSMVLRVQKPGKGIHYFAESEISLTGIFNRFSMGINFTL
ncbi:MAG: hypothetical protein KAH95_14310 [Spirochaetales bacterium]|nr:hypothetical protein [Spirochaetales bacterium]